MELITTIRDTDFGLTTIEFENGALFMVERDLVFLKKAKKAIGLEG
jgi:hypothetical protein